ncbi:MAG: GNAT family protein [Opitutus sp.]
MLSHHINPGLELRLLQVTDAPTLFAAVDAHRAFLGEWLHWVDTTITIRDAEKFIAAGLQEYATSQAFTCGIWWSGKFVGAIGHNRIDWHNRMGNPGWWLIPEAQGKGIMTQCCKVVFHHAFTQLQLDRVCAGVATGNARGHAMVKRLGFIQISTLRNAEKLRGRRVDHVIYALNSPHAAMPNPSPLFSKR